MIRLEEIRDPVAALFLRQLPEPVAERGPGVDGALPGR
jgi:hypothetical protein